MGLKLDKNLKTNCIEILERLYSYAETSKLSLNLSEEVERNLDILVHSNVGAPVRVLIALLLAKLIDPEVNILYPVARGVKEKGAFSGRKVDENCVQVLVSRYKLPLIRTTGFLTPAFRTLSLPIPEKLGEVVGKNKQVYNAFSSIVHKVHYGELRAYDVLLALLQRLILLKRRREELLSERLQNLEGLAVSVEDIVAVLKQLLTLPRASRIPVLITAALHKTIEACLGYRVKPLESHTAADSKTGNLGDVELVLDDGSVVKVYEIKSKKVTEADIYIALRKISALDEQERKKLKQYLFITTEQTEESVLLETRKVYKKTGIEMAILDCIDFVRYFLHLFFPLRGKFVENLTQLIVAEPDSAVSYKIKEHYLNLLKEGM